MRNNKGTGALVAPVFITILICSQEKCILIGYNKIIKHDMKHRLENIVVSFIHNVKVRKQHGYRDFKENSSVH